MTTHHSQSINELEVESRTNTPANWARKAQSPAAYLYLPRVDLHTGRVEGNVAGRLKHLDFDLHGAADAVVSVDERLDPQDVVGRSECRGQTSIPVLGFFSDALFDDDDIRRGR